MFCKRNFWLHGYPRLKCRFSGYLNFLTCQMKCYFSCFRILRFKKDLFWPFLIKKRICSSPIERTHFSQFDVRRFNFSPIKDIIVKSMQIFLIQEIYIFLIFLDFHPLYPYMSTLEQMFLCPAGLESNFFFGNNVVKTVQGILSLKKHEKSRDPAGPKSRMFQISALSH